MRMSLVLAGFEAGMPVVGIAAGHALGGAVGSIADVVAAAMLVALGAYLLAASDESEAVRARLLARAHGLALIGLGVAISLDELAIGLSIGLLDLPVVAALVLIAAQAFVAAQLGVRLGARIGETMRERTEQAAALALISVGLVLLALRFS